MLVQYALEKGVGGGKRVLDPLALRAVEDCVQEGQAGNDVADHAGAGEVLDQVFDHHAVQLVRSCHCLLVIDRHHRDRLKCCQLQQEVVPTSTAS